MFTFFYLAPYGKRKKKAGPFHCSCATFLDSREFIAEGEGSNYL
jgi:hypothetical protein